MSSRNLVAIAVAAALAAFVVAPASAERAFAPDVEAERQLRALLERDHAGEMPGHRVIFSRDRVGCAVVVRAAIDPPLYPGTGVRTVLVGPDGGTYGQHGRSDLADLARRCGWLTTPPTPAVAQSLISFALLDGMLATHGTTVVTVTSGTLALSVRRAEPLSGRDVEDIVVVLPATGLARIERRPVSG